MAFPHTPLNLLVEMFIDGVWTDITSDVYVRDGINITRGKADESSQTQPSSCTLTLNNRDGKYSPRNPLGVYYGKIGRNTQIRVEAEFFSRFTGEVASWPAKWDTSGNDAYVQVEAAGILRRIGQGSQPVTSALKGYLLSTSPVTYWPLDDGTDATTGAPVHGTYQGATFRRQTGRGVFTFGDGVLGNHLAPTLRINDLVPASGFDFLSGFCLGSDTTPDALAWEFVFRADPVIALGKNMSGWFFQAAVNGTAGTTDEWRVIFRTGADDDIELQLWLDVTGTSTGVSLANTGVLDAITDGELHHVRLALTQSGANVDYAVFLDGTSVLSGTRNTHTLRDTRTASVQYDRLVGEDLLAFGHLIVWENAVNIPPIADTSGLALGFAGETAGDRFLRLTSEFLGSGLVFGVLADSMPMGVQYEDYFSNQLTEIEATDRGMIYEPRGEFNLGYQTRSSAYNQTAVVTIDYSAGELATPFEPVEDDQQIRNDIFAQRREGSSYRATLESGPLSVQDPPLGVGRYKDEVQVNVETDAMLPEIAGWLLGVGTVDEARYPRVTVDLAAVAGNPGLFGDLIGVDIGDLIVITGTSELNIYDDIKLLVLGYTETLGPYEWRITFNCAPYSPFEVLQLDAADSRIDPGDASSLTSAITSSAMSVSVTSTAGTLWTTAAGDLPVSVMVGGEEMTVTAISGAASPQTFTVTRAVNGVVKAHSSGGVVRLKRPGVIAL